VNTNVLSVLFCHGAGKGVYGDVMLAKTRVDDDDDDCDGDGDSLVMVKSLLSRNDAHIATCRREVELFSRVGHDHVTRLVAVCCKMEPLYLVTEYCEWVRLLIPDIYKRINCQYDSLCCITIIG